ncbi:hypothetical protein D9M68_527460 [compost metagenome]
MGTPVTFKIMAHIIRESTGPKNCRFIHIIPKSGHPEVQQLFIQASPPFAHFGVGEIRKLAAARPYMAFHKIIIAAAAKIIILFPLFEDPVVIIDLYPRIDHHHGLHPYSRQVADHFLRVRKILFIPCKAAIAIHVVDIEVNGIAWNLEIPEGLGNFPHFRFRIVTPPALMVA